MPTCSNEEPVRHKDPLQSKIHTFYKKREIKNSLQPHGLQCTRFPCPSPFPRVCSNSRPLSQWCHSTISSFVIPFSSCFQSFPVSGSLLMSQLFASDGQSLGASASASIFPVHIQDWFPLGLTGLISLLSKGFSRIFSSTKIQASILWCSAFFFHICMWLLERP